MDENDPLDTRRQDALVRFSDARLREAEQSEVIDPPSRILERAAVYIGAALVAGALFLLYVGTVDVVVKVRGQVVPQSELIAVQSRNTGILSDVFVDLGDTVEKDQVIAQLAGAIAAADLEALERRIALRASEASRLLKEIVATETLVTDFDSLAQAEDDLALYGDLVDRVQRLRLNQQEVARLERLAGSELVRLKAINTAQIDALLRTIAIREANLERLRAETTTLVESVKLREEQLEGIEELITTGLSTRARALEVRDTVLVAQTALSVQNEKVGELQLEISKTELQITELQQQIATEESRRADLLAVARREEAGARSAVTAFLTDRRTVLRTLELEIDRARDELRFARQRAEALAIRAPAAGTLASLQYAAPGGRVVEGEEIARIVPKGVPNILRAALPGRDAGKVEIGQRAIVKLDAFPFYRFGTIPAEVIAIFPEPQGNGFGVRLELQRQTLGADGQGDRIEAGLDATIEIVTEKRSLLALLFDKGAKAFTSQPVERPSPASGNARPVGAAGAGT